MTSKRPNRKPGNRAPKGPDGIRTKRTPEAVAKFLDELENGLTVSEAAEAAGVRRRTPYDWAEKDKKFAAEMAKSMRIGGDAFEKEMRRRGVDGVDEPVFYEGQEVAKVKKYSDGLLVRLAESRKPDVFRQNVKVEQKVTHSIADRLKKALERAGKSGA